MVSLKKYIKTFLFGLLAGLSFPPLYFVVFLPLSFCYLLTKIENATSNKNAFSSGLIFGFGYFLVQLYWISFSLLVDIKTYFWLIPFAISIIPLMCGAFIGLTTVMLYFLIKKFNIENRCIITILFAILYVFFEYLRGLIFPWNLFSYIVGFSNILMQPVSIINIYFYDVILVFLLCFGYVFFSYKDKNIIVNKKYKNYVYIYFIIILMIVLFGFVRLQNANNKNFNINVKLVQANIKQNLKWDKNEIKNNLQKYINLSEDDYSDIIIWSESSIPYIVNKNTKIDFINNKVLITGAVRGEFKDNKLNKIWNSIFIFKDGKVENYYDKHILVPFGEYIPFSKYLPFVKKITNGNIDFSSGNMYNNIKIKDINFNPIICYEIAFPNYVAKKSKKADIILNLTNDGWFGISSGPYQHLVASRFRAVENKIPVIRVSNSGITAYIDEYGRIVKKINLNIEGILDLKI